MVSLLLFVTACAKKKSVYVPEQTTVVDIDFDEGLGKGHRVFSLVEKSSADKTRYRVTKKVWQRHRPSFVLQKNSTVIPKKIHQIWLGPKRPPPFFLKFRESWLKQHPDWEYHLWTDADLKTLDFELRDLFDQSNNYGEKSDILRCEILLKYGGIYVDADFECLKPFDEIASKYDFFAGIEPPHEIPESDHVLLISNALIGSVPRHPILRRWKEMIRQRWQRAEDECITPIEKVLVRTFLSFGDAVDEELESQQHTNVVFPSTYFYPIKPFYLRNPPEPPNIIKKVLIAFDLKKDHSFAFVNPETMAVHHFASSWQKSTGELFKDMQREIIKLKKEQTELAEDVAKLKREYANRGPTQ